LTFISLFDLKNSYANITPKNDYSISNEVYEFVTFNLLSGHKPSNDKKEYLLGLEVKLSPNWKIYWRNPGDAGLPPEISWENTENIRAVNLLFPTPKRFSFFDIETFGYENEVVFPLEIKLIDNKKNINGFIELSAQVCSQICVPVTQKFDLNKLNDSFQDINSLKKINNYKNKVPQKISKNELKLVSGYIYQNLLKLKFENSIKDKFYDVIAEDKKDFIYSKSNIFADDKYLNIEFDLSNSDETIDSLKLTFLSNNISYQMLIDNFNKKLIQMPSSNTNLGLKIVIIAFLGGFILNFMPCVLPVLSLKMIQLVNYRTESTQVYRKKIIFNILGILTTFLLFSLLTYLIKATGNYVGWGIQFQSPYFLIFMILLTLLFALNLFGIFHYFLPSKFLTLLSYKPDGYFGDFTTGMFLTLLATPCTAPLVGTAIGFALSGNIIDIFSILLFMGIGLSLPLILFLFFPRLITIIPKPGNWLNIFKKIMAFFLLITSFWLMSILFSLVKPKNESSNSKFYAETRWDIDKNLFYPSQLAKEGKIVFVDITADWCLTCQVNKKIVLDNPEMIQFFKKNKVVLLQLDWTSPNNKIKEFLTIKKRYGIPYNEIYSPSFPNGKILPEILTKNIVKEYINLVQ
jgi:suppressor for copper-sensitivity B